MIDSALSELNEKQANMILRRLGNKKKIAGKIQQHFPDHKVYVEPFFGAGGMFFSKPQAKYNLVNDIDSDVFNLFMVVTTRKKELEKAFHKMPVHEDLLKHWKANTETDPIRKAIRFLFISNFTYLGKMDSLRTNPRNQKQALYDHIDKTHDLLFDVQFFNKDFRKFLSSLSVDEEKRKLSHTTFIYNDPPYLGTGNNYSNSFKEQDSADLFDANQKTGCLWAMSEFDHPFILDQAKQKGLNVIEIGERVNIKNKRVEILVTNYEDRQQKMF